MLVGQYIPKNKRFTKSLGKGRVKRNSILLPWSVQVNSSQVRFDFLLLFWNSKCEPVSSGHLNHIRSGAKYFLKNHPVFTDNMLTSTWRRLHIVSVFLCKPSKFSDSRVKQSLTYFLKAGFAHVLHTRLVNVPLCLITCSTARGSLVPLMFHVALLSEWSYDHHRNPNNNTEIILPGD